MSSYAPLFMVGLPRSGTNLLTRMLNTHSEVAVAIHAFQPLFKSLRNAAMRHLGDAELQKWADPDVSFHDGHFDLRQVRLLDLLQSAPLDLPFDPGEWNSLLQRLTSRASDDAADLCDGLGGLAGASDYRIMVDRCLALIAKMRDAGSRRWVGMIDTWIIDSFPALARAYPEARFVVVERDLRAIVTSILGYLTIDPGQVGHVLSVVRHWRKEGALLKRFGADPDFAGRLRVVRYEALVGEPEQTVRDLCSFLGIDFEGSMVHVSDIVDPTTGKRWQGNSTFDAELAEISTAPADRWRQLLDSEALAMIEFAAGTDMLLRGYEPILEEDWLAQATEPLSFLIRDGLRECSWRSDFGNPQEDYGYEAYRRALLGFDIDTDLLNPADIRRAFLFDDYYHMLLSARRTTLRVEQTEAH